MTCDKSPTGLEAPKLESSLIRWLLDSDPSIRWQVMRDLIGAPADEVAAERARVAIEGAGARLLALQGADGRWAGAAWNRGWTSTMHALTLLREMGLDPTSEPARGAVGLVRDRVTWKGCGPPGCHGNSFFEGEVEPCINGQVAAAGAYFGGWMSDELTRRGYLDAPLRVAAFGFVGCGIFGAFAPLMPSASAALTLLAPAIFLSNTPYACAGTAIQMIVPNRARAQVSAIYVTLITLVGLGVGPLVVGLMTDRLFQDPADIRYSLAIVVAVPAPIMFALLMRARAPFRALRSASPESNEIDNDRRRHVGRQISTDVG